MGCNSSTPSVVLSDTDQKVLRRVTRRTINQDAVFILSLQFVLEVRRKQSPSADIDRLTSTVLNDQMSIRSFANAPPKVPYKSIVALRQGIGKTITLNARSELDAGLHAQLQSKISNKKERGKVIENGLMAATSTTVMDYLKKKIRIWQGKGADLPDDDSEKEDEAYYAAHPDIHVSSFKTRGGENLDFGTNTTSGGREDAAHSEPPSTAAASTNNNNNHHHNQQPTQQQGETKAQQRGLTLDEHAIHEQAAKEIVNTNHDGQQPPMLPEGDWVATEDPEYYWSDEQQLFYHVPTEKYYHSESNQWYDPMTGEWSEE